MSSPITSHVLDTALGKPAKGISAVLEFFDGKNWKEIGRGITNDDGRIRDLLPEQNTLKKGIYRLTFDTATYRKETPGFYPYIPIVFEIQQTNQHYHVPLLLSPFGYSTYRGS